jgi:hypothetical protein
MEDEILKIATDIIDNLCDKPESSLCDNCQFAQIVSGGFISIGLKKSYKQRYCPHPLASEKLGGRNISISGFTECEYYLAKENNATPNRP